MDRHLHRIGRLLIVWLAVLAALFAVPFGTASCSSKRRPAVSPFDEDVVVGSLAILPIPSQAVPEHKQDQARSLGLQIPLDPQSQPGVREIRGIPAANEPVLPRYPMALPFFARIQREKDVQVSAARRRVVVVHPPGAARNRHPYAGDHGRR